MCHQYFNGIAPEQELQEALEKNLQDRWEDVSSRTLQLLNSYQFHLALEETMGFVRSINKYADDRAPWKLAKSETEEDKKRLATSLATMLEGLRLANELLAPVMPSAHAKICECLGQIPAEKWSGRLTGVIALAELIRPKTILFPRD